MYDSKLDIFAYKRIYYTDENLLIEMQVLPGT